MADSVGAKTPHQRRGEGSLLKAVAFVNLGVLLFSSMGVLIKLGAEHFDSFQLAAARNVGGALVTFLLLANQMKWRVTPQKMVMRQWPMALGRGLTIALAQVCFFFALTRIELATVTTITYIVPIIVTALSVVVLGDRVGPWRWAAVGVGFFGILLVIRPFGVDFHWVLLLPLCAALGYGINLVTVRLFDSDVPTLLINNYSNFGSAVISIGIVVVLSQSGWEAPLSAWLIVAAIGAIGGLGVYFISAGYREVTPSKVAAFDYFGLIYALVFGWLFFDEAPLERLIPGVFLIVGAGFLILWRERVNAAKAPSAP